jgi:uncharacterized protein (DUF952 family)
MGPGGRRLAIVLVHHLALPDDWARAREAGVYEVSTRGVTLAQAGFIHASTSRQWPVVRERFYADCPHLVLLTIETDLVEATLRWEPGVAGGSELFPHLYGPIPVAAVVATADLSTH